MDICCQIKTTTKAQIDEKFEMNYELRETKQENTVVTFCLCSAERSMFSVILG